MSNDPKTIIEESYDHIADWYLQWIENQKSPRERYTTKVLDKAPPSPAILELGCGPGIPVLKMLLEYGANVVANDISKKQIEIAKLRCPNAKLIAGDMTTLDFEAQTFDGAISFHTLFHLPRAQLICMLTRIYGWLKPGTFFACSLATFDEEDIHGEFLGYGTYWSSYGVEKNRALLKQAGFQLVEVEVSKAGNGQLKEDEPDYEAEFMWVLARKPERNA